MICVNGGVEHCLFDCLLHYADYRACNLRPNGMPVPKVVQLLQQLPKQAVFTQLN